MKSLVRFLLNCYLVPVRWSSRMALYMKGIIFSHDQHFVCALDVIRRYYSKDKGPVVDVGAFDGDSTTFFAKRLPNNAVLGFEPNPLPYEKSLIHRSRYKNIEFHNLAFGDKKGESDLFITSNQVSASLLKAGETNEFQASGIIKVNVTTLDEFFAAYDHILLLKLDVQGVELKVLAGGERTLRKTKLVLTEMLNEKYYQGNCYYHEVDAQLRLFGFKLHTVISDYNFEGTKNFDALYINASFI